jgi:hypothetical protein
VKLLNYLIWLGEAALKPGGVFHLIAGVADKLLSDFRNVVDFSTEQIFLKSATGRWLDAWGWDLVRLRRKFGEDDDSYRMRIYQAMLRLRATRRALREMIVIALGKPPIEIYEPIRDSAFWDSNDFYIGARSDNLSAATDGSGLYCGRLGTLGDTSYTGLVRVSLPELAALGQGLHFFNGRDFYEAEAFYLSAERQKLPGRAEFISLIEQTIPAGTQVSVEFV